jgi:hypothetical protein
VNQKKYNSKFHTTRSGHGATLSFDITYSTTKTHKPGADSGNSAVFELSGHENSSDAATRTAVFISPKYCISKCRMNVILYSTLKKDFILNQHIRLKGDLLHIGSELQICDADDPNRFGVVTMYTDKGPMTQLHVSVSPDVVYLQCCPMLVSHMQGGQLLTAKLRLFYLDSFGVCRLLDREVQLRKKNQQEEAAKAKIEAIKITRKLKDDARSILNDNFSLNSEEFCMLHLRRGFLLSQPVISNIVEEIMSKLFPETKADTCIKFFGSKRGPWDIFSMFNSISSFSPKKIVELVVACTPDASPQHRDYARERLKRILDDTFLVRNMWAHVGASDADCRKALQAIIDFIAFTKCFCPLKYLEQCDAVVQDLVTVIKSMNDYTRNVHISIDDVSYCFFLRSIRGVSRICTELQENFPDLVISKELKIQMDYKNSSLAMKLRRQSKEIEVREVVLAVQNLPKNQMNGQIDLPQLKSDCQLIRTTRNALAHATSTSSKVILIMVTLGAVARLVEYLNHSLQQQRTYPSLDDMATRIYGFVTTIKSNQAMLMHLCRRTSSNSDQVHLFDPDLLLHFLVETVDSEERQYLQNCPYLALAEPGDTKATDFTKIQLILGRKMAGPVVCSAAMKLIQKNLGFDKRGNVENEYPIKPEKHADGSNIFSHAAVYEEPAINWHQALGRENVQKRESPIPSKMGPGKSQAPEDKLKLCRSVLKSVALLPPGARGSVDDALASISGSRSILGTR